MSGSHLRAVLLQKRIMIGVVYVPPTDSSYNGIKQDIFDIIELEYSKCANNYAIFLCGDLNARTSTLPDIITDEFTAFNGGQPNFVCSNKPIHSVIIWTLRQTSMVNCY